jgi:outer membrane lipopolysaccharide assembly protein LptE/RlpB
MLAKSMIYILICISLAVNGCGWQLRDMSPIANDLGNVYVSYSDSQANIGLALRRELNASHVKLVETNAEADYLIKIIDTQNSRRISAVNINIRASQHQLYQAVDFMMIDNMGKQIIPLTTAYAERTHDFNEKDVLASQNAESLIQDSLRFDIVRQMLSRISEATISTELVK